jgi:hypothetical protein
MSSFPATFDIPGLGHDIEPLRIREVLRRFDKEYDLRGVFGRLVDPLADSPASPSLIKRCSLFVKNGRFAGI